MLCTASIPIKIKAIELTSLTIQEVPCAVSISLPATKGKVSKVKEENRRKTKPEIKASLYGIKNRKIPPSLLRFCLFNFRFSSGSSAVPRFFGHSVFSC